MIESLCFDLAPFIDSESRILILGSMPGRMSIVTEQYYAHPQNRFWRVLAEILENAPAPQTYEEKLALCSKHNIALWDSIASCQREGSLDADISGVMSNDFKWLFATYPGITTVCFNGAKSYAVFKKYWGELLHRGNINWQPLPSTSGANFKWRFEQLVETWRAALRAKDNKS